MGMRAPRFESLDQGQYLSEPRLRSDRDVVGGSPPMQALRRLIHAFAPYDVPLLLEGEESTGKRLVAEVVHGLSLYRHGPFIAVDCAALPEMLLAVELFGCAPDICAHYVSGFPGKVELARGGTLFLEHLEMMPKWAQARLFRVLEDHAVERMGGSASVPVSARIIGSVVGCGNRDETSGLRSRALLDRLGGGFVLKVPPLRDRGRDVSLLSQHFLAHANWTEGKQIEGFSPAALTALEAYTWPGNLRELQAVIGAAMQRADRLILPEHLSLPLQRNQPRRVRTAASGARTYMVPPAVSGKRR